MRALDCGNAMVRQAALNALDASLQGVLPGQVRLRTGSCLGGLGPMICAAAVVVADSDDRLMSSGVISPNPSLLMGMGPPHAHSCLRTRLPSEPEVRWQTRCRPHLPPQVQSSEGGGGDTPGAITPAESVQVTLLVGCC